MPAHVGLCVGPSELPAAPSAFNPAFAAVRRCGGRGAAGRRFAPCGGTAAERGAQAARRRARWRLPTVAVRLIEAGRQHLRSPRLRIRARRGAQRCTDAARQFSAAIAAVRRCLGLGVGGRRHAFRMARWRGAQRVADTPSREGGRRGPPMRRPRRSWTAVRARSKTAAAWGARAARRFEAL